MEIIDYDAIKKDVVNRITQGYPDDNFGDLARRIANLSADVTIAILQERDSRSSHQ